jgi:hypothetical protein
MSEQTYQIGVTLRGSEPPIWRRLLVPAALRLSELHTVLQVAMGWHDDHLHQFVAGKRRYGVPDHDGWSQTLDERTVTLGQVLQRPKQSLVYEYDFGDGWEHEVVLEQGVAADPELRLPRCLTGEGACPPEDVGGIWGYRELLQALQDPGHPEHEEYLEWVDEGFDPATFSAAAVNEVLARLVFGDPDDLDDLDALDRLADDVPFAAPSNAVPSEVVEATWQRVGTMDGAAVTKIARRWTKAQRELVGFVLGALEGLRAEAMELGFYVAVVVMEIFRHGPAKKIKRVKEAKIERLLLANHRILAEVPEDEADPLPAGLAAGTVQEPAVLRYVWEALVEEPPREGGVSPLPMRSAAASWWCSRRWSTPSTGRRGSDHEGRQEPAPQGCGAPHGAVAGDLDEGRAGTKTDHGGGDHHRRQVSPLGLGKGAQPVELEGKEGHGEQQQGERGTDRRRG